MTSLIPGQIDGWALYFGLKEIEVVVGTVGPANQKPPRQENWMFRSAQRHPRFPLP